MSDHIHNKNKDACSTPHMNGDAANADRSYRGAYANRLSLRIRVPDSARQWRTGLQKAACFTFVLSLGAVVVLSFLPDTVQMVSMVARWGALAHIGAYGALSFLFVLALPNRRHHAIAVDLLVVVSVVIEPLQAFAVNYRAGSWEDVAANIAGAMMGYGAAKLVLIWSERAVR